MIKTKIFSNSNDALNYFESIKHNMEYHIFTGRKGNKYAVYVKKVI